MAELSAELRGDDEVWLSGRCDPAAYARICGPLVAAGRVAHYVEVAADDAAELEAWFALAFGRQQVYASRPFGPHEPYDGPLRVRRGDLDDALALGNVIREHHHAPPVWSAQPPMAPEQLHEMWSGFLDEDGVGYWVAELEGERVAHLALDGVYLAVGATVPHARGKGAMRALWAAAQRWALDRGHETCDTDWRSTNPEADRAWRALGFTPTRYRLHRLVGR